MSPTGATASCGVKIYSGDKKEKRAVLGGSLGFYCLWAWRMSCRKFSKARRSLGELGTVNVSCPVGAVKRPCLPPRRKAHPLRTNCLTKRLMSLELQYFMSPFTFVNWRDGLVPLALFFDLNVGVQLRNSGYLMEVTLMVTISSPPKPRRVGFEMFNWPFWFSVQLLLYDLISAEGAQVALPIH